MFWEGKFIFDINKVWERLEKVEYERELVLWNEFIRQEKLEQFVCRFDCKVVMREIWLSENQCLVFQDNFGFDFFVVEVVIKKYEVIEIDIVVYEECVQVVVVVVREFEVENYYDIKCIIVRKDNVIWFWEYLLELFRVWRQWFEMNLGLQKIFQEMFYIMDWMDEMKVLVLF